MDVDWTTQDTGLPWRFVDEAAPPSTIVPGAFVVAGRGSAVAVAEVVDVGEDGVVHLRDAGGSLEQNLHLLEIAVFVMASAVRSSPPRTRRSPSRAGTRLA